MKKFLFTILLFFVPLVLVIVLRFNADGYTDPFYLRFTSPKQKSLIIGTSRAAQGIVPGIINKVLKRNDLYNYAFTILHSPFGPTYLESIEDKVLPGSTGGVFLISVDPWSISSTTEDPNDSAHFEELKLALAKTKINNINPNLFYLLESYDQPFINLLKKQKNEGIFLHTNGWLEVTVLMDSVSVSERIKLKVSDYKINNLPKYKYSELRERYLITIINFLKTHGEVYLIRMPVYKKIFEIENILMPEFDNKMIGIGRMTNTRYFNMTNENDNYEYVDGNHLYKSSAEIVSTKIADWIKSN